MYKNLQIFFHRSSEYCDKPGNVPAHGPGSHMFLLGWATLYQQTGGGGTTVLCQGLLIAIKRGGTQDAVADVSDHH